MRPSPACAASTPSGNLCDQRTKIATARIPRTSHLRPSGRACGSDRLAALLDELVQLAVGRPEVGVAKALVLVCVVDVDAGGAQLLDRGGDVRDEEADGARRVAFVASLGGT